MDSKYSAAWFANIIIFLFNSRHIIKYSNHIKSWIVIFIDHIGPSLLQEMKNVHRQTLSFSWRQLLNCYSPQCFALSLMLDGTHVQHYASRVFFTLTYIISMYATLSWFYLCTSSATNLKAIELSVRSWKEGTWTPVWPKQGMKPEIGHEKNTKGLNRVPNSGSNEFGPKFLPINAIFYARNFTHLGAFGLLIFSSQSLLVCIWAKYLFFECECFH